MYMYSVYDLLLGLSLVLERFLIPDNRDDFFTCAQRSRIVRIILFIIMIHVFSFHENFMAGFIARKLLSMSFGSNFIH